MELCDKDCDNCPAKQYGGIYTRCKIMNSIIRLNEMKIEAYRSMKDYWDNKEQVINMMTIDMECTKICDERDCVRRTLGGKFYVCEHLELTLISIDIKENKL